MNVANMAVVLALLLMYVLYLTRPQESMEGFRTKCFSCEAQDHAMGLDRGYGSKCFDCEWTQTTSF